MNSLSVVSCRERSTLASVAGPTTRKRRRGKARRRTECGTSRSNRRRVISTSPTTDASTARIVLRREPRDRARGADRADAGVRYVRQTGRSCHRCEIIKLSMLALVWRVTSWSYKGSPECPARGPEGVAAAAAAPGRRLAGPAASCDRRRDLAEVIRRPARAAAGLPARGPAITRAFRARMLALGSSLTSSASLALRLRSTADAPRSHPHRIAIPLRVNPRVHVVHHAARSRPRSRAGPRQSGAASPLRGWVPTCDVTRMRPGHPRLTHQLESNWPATIEILRRRVGDEARAPIMDLARRGGRREGDRQAVLRTHGASARRGELSGRLVTTEGHA